jgi:hypothetical protein
VFTPLSNDLTSSIYSSTTKTVQKKSLFSFEEYLRAKTMTSDSPLLQRGNLSGMSGSSYLGGSPYGYAKSPFLSDHFSSPLLTRGGSYNSSSPTYQPDQVSQTSRTSKVSSAQPGQYDYNVVKVGEVDRAPMAMFEHNGELLISAITRNGIDETPIWSYSQGQGVEKRSQLPEQAESGHYGFSFGDGFHLVPESNGGMIDYTADSPDGPWVKHDYSHLNPHPYKELNWGYAYKSPETGEQFMGFGNRDHPGVVIKYNEQAGDWETFAAPEDMRFPTGMGVISEGENKGTTLISSATYGRSMIHKVNPDGSTEKVADFGDWGLMRLDPNEEVAYMTVGNGRVYWADFDNLDQWKECKYEKPSGSVDHVETGLGEPGIHPDTGCMIFNALDMEKGNTAFYEAQRQGDDIVLNQVLFLEGVGQWAGKTATAGGDMYFGSGVTTGKSADATHGAIYRLTANKLA